MAEFITDVFLVTARDSDFSTFILETTIKNHDGNLWEQTWRHKGKRFLGFKRNPDDQYVVTDITVVEEDKDIPDDYAGLLITKDTKEKGSRKYVICYKRDSRNSVNKAITEVNVINESKGELVPAQFTSVNSSINDVLIVFKIQDVVTQPKPPKLPPRQSPSVQVQQFQQHSAGVPSSPISGIEGVPFQINPKYNTQSTHNNPMLNEIHKISLDDIIAKYSYSFHTEKGVIPTS